MITLLVHSPKKNNVNTVLNKIGTVFLSFFGNDHISPVLLEILIWGMCIFYWGEISILTVVQLFSFFIQSYLPRCGNLFLLFLWKSVLLLLKISVQMLPFLYSFYIYILISISIWDLFPDSFLFMWVIIAIIKYLAFL